MELRIDIKVNIINEIGNFAYLVRLARTNDVTKKWLAVIRNDREGGSMWDRMVMNLPN